MFIVAEFMLLMNIFKRRVISIFEFCAVVTIDDIKFPRPVRVPEELAAFGIICMSVDDLKKKFTPALKKG